MRGKSETSKKATPAEVAPVGHACGPEEHPKRRRRSTVTDDDLERAAALFRAFGDVARLRLLERLADGEWCVTELADAAGVGLSTVSQQLRLLRAERIVKRRRAGKHIFYGLADAHILDLVENALVHASEKPRGDGSADDSHVGHDHTHDKENP